MKKRADINDEPPGQERWERAAAGAVGGAIGWGAGLAAAQRPGKKAAAVIERRVAATATRALRGTKAPAALVGPIRQARGVAGSLGMGGDGGAAAARNAAGKVVRSQGRAAGRIAGMAVRGAVAFTGAGLGSIAGDAAGDLAAANARRKAAGREGTDEVRRISTPGVAAAGALGLGAQLAIESRRAFRRAPRAKLLAGIGAGSAGSLVGEMAVETKMNRMAPPGMQKRAGDGQVTEAERQQRVNAAKARWANRSTMGAGSEAAPAKKPWTGQQLGLGREVRVQAQSMLNPVWQHNYQGAEWGYGRDGAPKEAGGKTYLSLNRKPQKPKGMTDAQFIELGRWAHGVANDRRADIIAEGLGEQLIGEDGRDRLRNRKTKPTIPESKRGDKEAIKLAFNHARMFAMNDVGLIRVDPDFRLTPEAKEKLQGMERFMWRARRQISNDLRNGRGEVWSQIREEHGDTFADGRLGPDGKPKRYFPYHANMVKRWGAGALMKRAATP